MNDTGNTGNTSNTGKKKTLLYFSPLRIVLYKEIVMHHPKVHLAISNAVKESDDSSEEFIIGVVAAEFNIIMDGLYSREQLDKMYDILIEKLRDKRTINIIIPKGMH